LDQIAPDFQLLIAGAMGDGINNHIDQVFNIDPLFISSGLIFQLFLPF
jgi:hypothetical protein